MFFQFPVDFEDIELGSKDPSDDALENAITAIERNGIALKVSLKVYLNIFLGKY